MWKLLLTVFWSPLEALGLMTAVHLEDKIRAAEEAEPGELQFLPLLSSSLHVLTFPAHHSHHQSQKHCLSPAALDSDAMRLDAVWPFVPRKQLVTPGPAAPLLSLALFFPLNA